MTSIKNSINNYHESLLTIQLAIDRYSQSIQQLMNKLQSNSEDNIDNQCENLLLMTFNTITEIQHILSKKNMLLKLNTASLPSLLSKTIPKSRYLNMVNYHGKLIDYNHLLVNSIKVVSPVKPWLSQKVYSNSK